MSVAANLAIGLSIATLDATFLHAEKLHFPNAVLKSPDRRIKGQAVVHCILHLHFILLREKSDYYNRPRTSTINVLRALCYGCKSPNPILGKLKRVILVW